MTYCKAISCYRERLPTPPKPTFLESIITLGIANIMARERLWCDYHSECLGKVVEKTNIVNEISNNDGFGFPTICEMETFETYFNGNCGYLIIKNPPASSSYPFFIWIVVYEPAVRSMSEKVSAIKYGTNYGGLERAKEVARDLKRKLQDNDFHATPMLYVHPGADYYKYFSNLITSSYVIKENWYHKITEPSLYFKPLDIAKVNERKAGVNFDHVGIYIGNDLVCHFTKGCNGVRIHSWSVFLEDYHTGNGTITRYHPVIPFKYFRKITWQIGWARERKFREDNYNLTDRNCEHLANMLVYGINFSEQVEEKKEIISLFQTSIGCIFAAGQTINNDKGSSIKLTSEVNKTNSMLGKGYNSLSEEIESQYLQEVPPKQECRIM